MDKKVSLVTGAGRGIGRASALVLADAGSDVALVARTESQLNDVAKAIEARGQMATVLPFDMMDVDSLSEVVDATISNHGRLDLLVNNAGGSPPKPLLDTSVNMFERAFRFNVTTAFELSKHAIPHLLETGGSIVNISSAIGRLTDRGMAAYGTAKAALSHLTRLMATECAPKVRVNAIAVGATETSALRSVLDDNLRGLMEDGTPLGRLGKPGDIANAVLFLASSASNYITGKVIEVDGGIEAPNLKLGLPDLGVRRS